MGGLPHAGAASAIAAAAAAVPAGQLEVGGRRYMPDAKGNLTPLELVKPQHKLQDQAVRELFSAAEALAEKISAFKTKAFGDVDALVELLEERYEAKIGGAKGNLTLFSYDGLLRVQLQVADQIRFGPELQAAKALIDECLSEFSSDAHPVVRAIVTKAFNVDKEGQVNRGALLGLKRYEVEDARWKRAMEAISDSVTVVDTKPYIRFSRRRDLDAAWENVSLNIATAAVAVASEPGAAQA